MARSHARRPCSCPSAICCFHGSTPSRTPRSRFASAGARAPTRGGRRGGCSAGRGSVGSRTPPPPGQRAAAFFWELGLDGFQLAPPAELSGGMRQRVAFLRTLLSGKPVLCLDEPFGALDAITRGEMQAWLSQTLAREPRTVVLVTHDVEEAILLADRVAILSPRPGRVIEELEVSEPRPRRRSDAAVIALRERALEILSLGQLRSGGQRRAT